MEHAVIVVWKEDGTRNIPTVNTVGVIGGFLTAA